MKFRRGAPAVLIGAVFLVVTGMAVLSNRLFSGLTTAVEECQFELMRSILDSSLKSAESRALARADMVASLPRARALVAARNREGLLAEYGEMFRIQKEKHGVDQSQFHIPPAISLLRLHAPDQHGDDLTKFRPMVVAVNQYKQTRKGLVIARTGPAVFGVVPVNDAAGQHVGSASL